ncbi:MAG: hypothetical protein WCH59_02150 [Chitinophagia bacterium]|jgi:hypothetical protein
MKAKAEKKIILLIVESTDCFYCNEITELGLSAPELKKLKNNAIFLHVDKVPSELLQSDVYSFRDNFSGLIFLDGDKHILDTYSGATSNYFLLEYKLKESIKVYKKSDFEISALEEKYSAGNKSFCDLYALIQKIIEKGLEPKQNYVDTLTRIAPADSAKSLYFLQFLFNTAPEIGSITEKYTLQKSENYYMAWWRMSLEKMSKINSRISSKSIEKAASLKDQNYLRTISNTISYIFSNSPAEMRKFASIYPTLEYYYQIKDTANYMRLAGLFYNLYLNQNVDSIFRNDSLRKEQIKNEVLQNNRIYKPERTIAFRLTDNITMAMRYAITLNKGARIHYTFSNNVNYLNDALQWAKKANELAESPDFMETYAKILYKTKQKDLAIQWETKAIELMKLKNKDFSKMNRVLAKMKSDEDNLEF